MSARLEDEKKKKRKKGMKILSIEKEKIQLTVKAPGTETITTFLSFHSSVDSLTADRLIVSNKKKVLGEGKSFTMATCALVNQFS